MSIGEVAIARTRMKLGLSHLKQQLHTYHIIASPNYPPPPLIVYIAGQHTKVYNFIYWSAPNMGSVRDENNVLQLAPAVTLVEQLRMPCGVCKSNDLNDTLLTGMLNAARLSCFAHCNI